MTTNTDKLALEALTLPGYGKEGARVQMEHSQIIVRPDWFRIGQTDVSLHGYIVEQRWPNAAPIQIARVGKEFIARQSPEIQSLVDRLVRTYNWERHPHEFVGEWEEKRNAALREIREKLKAAIQ